MASRPIRDGSGSCHSGASRDLCCRGRRARGRRCGRTLSRAVAAPRLQGEGPAREREHRPRYVLRGDVPDHVSSQPRTADAPGGAERRRSCRARSDRRPGRGDQFEPDLDQHRSQRPLPQDRRRHSRDDRRLPRSR